MSPDWEDRETPRDSGEDGKEERLDFEAEFRRIVEAYGDEPDVSPPSPPSPPAAPPAAAPPAAAPPPAPPKPDLSDRFRAHGWHETPDQGDSLNTGASWDEEGHFVPPDPGPMPLPSPRRLAAWVGVLGTPVLMLLLVALQVHPPTILTFLLVVAFVGGIVYLVATMDRRDDWPGDDGAVI